MQSKGSFIITLWRKYECRISSQGFQQVKPNNFVH
jgi:hypothetical protein